jgi:hypothetical protein
LRFGIVGSDMVAATRPERGEGQLRPEVIHVAPMSHGAAAILRNPLKTRGGMSQYARHEKGTLRTHKYLILFGWGTWIRTRTNGVRVPH